MKLIKVLAISFVLILPLALKAQEQKIYDTTADAKKDIAAAVEAAQKSNKHIFLQIGGNWCPWCIKFHNFVHDDEELSSYVADNFEVVKVNYDQNNKQEELLTELEFPQRFGFPVFVILDETGKRIHTQNSAFLEKDKSYDKDKISRFLKNWSPTALDPASYKK
ncbi:thioredoxin family protein [Draconibacterium sp. IB214405]|uniref:thioredoxin family protein n=1 Tax=Draconibacterium sp. IB214405 TaxID=3097352 RepID=UPI002A0FF73F|nr:thioredoxin family protein [Draconibacterium sp. IB214405]MDX8341632.1 thioredoxin family protein [Draconibacterium sp. IB214405]